MKYVLAVIFFVGVWWGTALAQQKQTPLETALSVKFAQELQASLSCAANSISLGETNAQLTAQLTEAEKQRKLLQATIDELRGMN